MRPGGIFDVSYAQDMAIIRTRFQWIAFIGLLVLLFGVVPFVASRLWLSVMNTMAITIIAALGLNILTGYTGQINLGQAAFVAVGAYISAGLSHFLGWSFWVTLPCAAIGTGLIGLLFSLPSLRIKGFYIAVSTLAAQVIILWIIIHASNVTGGVQGLSVPPPAIGDFVFDNEQKFYFLIMGFTALLVFLAKNIVRTRVGRALIAIRDNDIAAEFMGVNIFRYKIFAFVTCSVYAGIAGALLAHYLGLITPEYFPATDSVWYLGYLIVGGMGSITGTIFGVLFLKLIGQLIVMGGPPLGELIPAFGGTIVYSMLRFVFGAVIVLFLIFEPRGLYHRWQMLKASTRIWPFPY
jgi:branched-chain amino acid transport system permease protein